MCVFLLVELCTYYAPHVVLSLSITCITPATTTTTMTTAASPNPCTHTLFLSTFSPPNRVLVVPLVLSMLLALLVPLVLRGYDDYDCDYYCCPSAIAGQTLREFKVGNNASHVVKG